MISDQLGGSLHDRASRGKSLSAVEMQQLEAWYEEKDVQETQQLRMPEVPVDCMELQTQINAALDKIRTVSQRIQQVSAENAALRHNIFELQQALMIPKSA